MSKFPKFLSSLSFKKLFSNKRSSVAVSLLLSFVLWLAIIINENPTIERSFADMTVSVNLEGTIASENGMSMINDISSQKFTVIARGQTYLVSKLKNEDFTVFASAASVDAPGVYNLDVTATPRNSSKGYEVLKVVPSTVKVSFDYIDTKDFTVKAVAEGVTAKSGLIAENSVVSGTDGNVISVTGPRTVLNKIDSVVAYAKVNKTLDVSKTFNAAIKLYNSKKKEISLDNLQLSATKVKVTVPISKKKTVPINAVFENLPEGIKTSDLPFTLSNKTVTIIGKPETIEKTDKVNLAPIDITKVSRQKNSFKVSAALPDGVRLLDNIENFTVKFDVSNYVTRKIDVSKFEFKNLDGKLKATGDKIKNVTVFGPWYEVNNITNKKVYAVIDFSNKKVGQHTVKADFGIKDRTKTWVIGEYDATVTLKKK